MSEVESALKQADELYEQNEFQKQYEVLVKHKSEVSNCELQWKLARAARDLSQISSVVTKERAKELVYEGMECAENAVKADDNNFAAHKWKGILLSDIGSYEGIKRQIENAYVIRDEFKRASELNPSDALCYFLLGEWCFTVADMGWMQRKAAEAFFGSPPTSTYEEALALFEKAEEVNPGFYVGTYVSLGKVCLKLKKKEEAKKWLTKAEDYKIENEKDEKSIAEAKLMLKGL